METIPVIRMDRVTKIYPLPSGNVVALEKIDLTVMPGDFIAIMGPSGSGKSTLLNQIGSLDTPTYGEMCIDGINIKQLSDNELTDLRRDKIGFIFQKFHLIPLLTAYENVEYPFLLKYHMHDHTGLIHRILESVGITKELAVHTPSELSGGQQQRVAIARALVNNPPLLLCDEPTGNLDSKTGLLIMEMLRDLNEQGRTIIMVTHDQKTSDYAHRKIVIADGRIVS